VPAALQLDGVVKRYRWRGRAVLDGVSAVVEPGALVVVRGPNGSGKSTLLRVAGGAARPTQGRVRRPPRVGYVPEQGGDATGLTGRATLLHRARTAGGERTSAAGEASAAAERLGLDADVLAQPLAVLSKGQRQRVAIAAALTGAPSLLVLDEPWSGLDAAAATLLDGLLADCRAAGVAVLVADHRPEGPTAPDAVWRLQDGRVEIAADQPRVHIVATSAAGVPVELEVAPDAVDDTLRRLLAEGHSIRRVGG
jgi:ABC-type multidrug transport system ATPase subunit